MNAKISTHKLYCFYLFYHVLICLAVISRFIERCPFVLILVLSSPPVIASLPDCVHLFRVSACLLCLCIRGCFFEVIFQVLYR